MSTAGDITDVSCHYLPLSAAASTAAAVTARGNDVDGDDDVMPALSAIASNSVRPQAPVISLGLRPSIFVDDDCSS